MKWRNPFSRSQPVFEEIVPPEDDGALIGELCGCWLVIDDEHGERMLTDADGFSWGARPAAGVVVLRLIADLLVRFRRRATGGAAYAEVAGIVGAANAVNIRCGVTLDADFSVAIHRRL